MCHQIKSLTYKKAMLFNGSSYVINLPIAWLVDAVGNEQGTSMSSIDCNKVEPTTWFLRSSKLDCY